MEAEKMTIEEATVALRKAGVGVINGGVGNPGDFGYNTKNGGALNKLLRALREKREGLELINAADHVLAIFWGVEGCLESTVRVYRSLGALQDARNALAMAITGEPMDILNQPPIAYMVPCETYDQDERVELLEEEIQQLRDKLREAGAAEESMDLERADAGDAFIEALNYAMVVDGLSPIAAVERVARNFGSAVRLAPQITAGVGG